MIFYRLGINLINVLYRHWYYNVSNIHINIMILFNDLYLRACPTCSTGAICTTKISRYWTCPPGSVSRSCSCTSHSVISHACCTGSICCRANGRRSHIACRCGYTTRVGCCTRIITLEINKMK